MLQRYITRQTPLFVYGRFRIAAQHIGREHVPASFRRPPNREIRLSIIVEVFSNWLVAFESPLLDQQIGGMAGRDNEPGSNGRPPYGKIGFPVAVVIARNGDIAGKAPLLD